MCVSNKEKDEERYRKKNIISKVSKLLMSTHITHLYTTVN